MNSTTTNDCSATEVSLVQPEVVQPEVVPEVFDQIAGAFQHCGMERLKPIKEALPEEITYEQIRLVAAQMRRMAPAMCG